jgi:hypothetical protein
MTRIASVVVLIVFAVVLAWNAVADHRPATAMADAAQAEISLAAPISTMGASAVAVSSRLVW